MLKSIKYGSSGIYYMKKNYVTLLLIFLFLLRKMYANSIWVPRAKIKCSGFLLPFIYLTESLYGTFKRFVFKTNLSDAFTTLE